MSNFGCYGRARTAIFGLQTNAFPFKPRNNNKCKFFHKNFAKKHLVHFCTIVAGGLEPPSVDFNINALPVKLCNIFKNKTKKRPKKRIKNTKKINNIWRKIHKYNTNYTKKNSKKTAKNT